MNTPRLSKSKYTRKLGQPGNKRLPSCDVETHHLPVGFDTPNPCCPPHEPKNRACLIFTKNNFWPFLTGPSQEPLLGESETPHLRPCQLQKTLFLPAFWSECDEIAVRMLEDQTKTLPRIASRKKWIHFIALLQETPPDLSYSIPL